MNYKGILISFLWGVLVTFTCRGDLAKVKPLGYDFKQPTLGGEKQEKTHGDPAKVKLLDGINKLEKIAFVVNSTGTSNAHGNLIISNVILRKIT